MIDSKKSNIVFRAGRADPAGGFAIPPQDNILPHNKP